MLPLQPRDRQQRRVLDSLFGRLLAGLLLQRGQDCLDVRRLGEIVISAVFHGLNRRRDARITRQHENPRIGLKIAQGGDKRQPGIVAEVQVDGDLAKLLRVRQSQRRGGVVRLMRRIAAPRQTARENARENLVVVDDQKICIAHALFSVVTEAATPPRPVLAAFSRDSGALESARRRMACVPCGLAGVSSIDPPSRVAAENARYKPTPWPPCVLSTGIAPSEPRNAAGIPGPYRGHRIESRARQDAGLPTSSASPNRCWPAPHYPAEWSVFALPRRDRSETARRACAPSLHLSTHLPLQSTRNARGDGAAAIVQQTHAASHPAVAAARAQSRDCAGARARTCTTSFAAREVRYRRNRGRDAGRDGRNRVTPRSASRWSTAACRFRVRPSPPGHPAPRRARRAEAAPAHRPAQNPARAAPSTSAPRTSRSSPR